MFERLENLSDKHFEEWWQTSACEPGLHYLIDADTDTAATEQRIEEENLGMESEEEGCSNCFSHSMALHKTTWLKGGLNTMIFSHKGSLNYCEEMSIELTKTNRYLQLFVKM